MIFLSFTALVNPLGLEALAFGFTFLLYCVEGEIKPTSATFSRAESWIPRTSRASSDSWRSARLLAKTSQASRREYPPTASRSYLLNEVLVYPGVVRGLLPKEYKERVQDEDDSAGGGSDYYPPSTTPRSYSVVRGDA